MAFCIIMLRFPADEAPAITSKDSNIMACTEVIDAIRIFLLLLPAGQLRFRPGLFSLG